MSVLSTSAYREISTRLAEARPPSSESLLVGVLKVPRFATPLEFREADTADLIVLARATPNPRLLDILADEFVARLFTARAEGHGPSAELTQLGSGIISNPHAREGGKRRVDNLLRGKKH